MADPEPQIRGEGGGGGGGGGVRRSQFRPSDWSKNKLGVRAPPLDSPLLSLAFIM